MNIRMGAAIATGPRLVLESTIESDAKRLLSFEFQQRWWSQKLVLGWSGAGGVCLQGTKGKEDEGTEVKARGL